MSKIRSSPFREQSSGPEITHRKGEDHCTAGLQFNWIGYDQIIKYVVIWM